MYARTTTIKGDPRAMDEGIAHITDVVWPTVQRMSGCVGMSMLADREAGRCIVTSAWATDEAMRASAESVRAPSTPPVSRRSTATCARAMTTLDAAVPATMPAMPKGS